MLFSIVLKVTKIQSFSSTSYGQKRELNELNAVVIIKETLVCAWLT